MIRNTCLLILLVACGCSNQSPETTAKNNVDTNDHSIATSDKPASNGFWEKLVMLELKDVNGLVAAIVPFPSTWQLGSGAVKGASITGPNGIVVRDFPLRSFMNNYNSSLQQVYAQSGQAMREMPGIEQLVNEDFVPWGREQGMELVKFYEIPEVAKIDKWYSDQLFKAMPSRSDIKVIGIDWKKTDGSPYFTLIHLNASTSNDMQNWYYMFSGLEADADHFEKARKQYIFALANTRYNLEPIMTYNRQEASRVGQNWAAFNKRMAENQASFEASQRAHVNKSEAINDAIMNGWRQNNASSDKNQEAVIDGIYERTRVENSETGQQYKVSAGANQYWMNKDGEYISTKINDYNPNLDENMNAVKWQELKEVRKK